MPPARAPSTRGASPAYAAADSAEANCALHVGQLGWDRCRDAIQWAVVSLSAEGTELMDQTDARVELRVAGEVPLHLRHADQHQADAAPVENGA